MPNDGGSHHRLKGILLTSRRGATSLGSGDRRSPRPLVLALSERGDQLAAGKAVSKVVVISVSQKGKDHFKISG